MKKVTRDMMEKNLKSGKVADAEAYGILAYNKGGQLVSTVDCVKLEDLESWSSYSDCMWWVWDSAEEWNESVCEEIQPPAGLEFPILETRLGENYESEFYGAGQWPSYAEFALEVLNRDAPANNHRYFATVAEALEALPGWEDEIREKSEGLMDYEWPEIAEDEDGEV